jgi:hypothetical protein
MKMAVFCIVAPWSLIEVYGRFRGAFCLIRAVMEGVRACETSVNSYQSTRRNNPEDSHLHTRRRENHIYHKSKTVQLPKIEI